MANAIFLQRARAVATSALFAAAIAAPLIAQLATSGASVSEQEKRALAPAPRLADMRADWPEFPGRATAWMNDHFGFRAALIGLYASARDELKLDSGALVVRGADGWFFGAIDDALAMHEGLAPFTKVEADAWLARIVRFRDAAEAAGATFAVIGPPNKHSVYPEYLPDHPRRVAGEGRIATLARRAPEIGVTFLDPASAVRAGKPRAQLYYRTDTHWTPYGAYLAYRALMATLRAQGVAVPVVEEDALRFRTVSGFAGDLNGLAGNLDPVEESLETPRIAHPDPIADEIRLPAYDFRRFKARRYVMADRGRRSILVIGDSFAEGLMPYLRESFDEVTFVHHQFGAVPDAVFEEGRYDVVLLEVVERLWTYRPREPALPDDPVGAGE